MRIGVTGTDPPRPSPPAILKGISSAGKIEELLSFLKAVGQFRYFTAKPGH
jgi:hypothetical protein